MPVTSKNITLVGTRLEAWLERRVKARIATRLQVLRAEVTLIIEDLAENGPAHTGASAGRYDRRVVEMYPSHPAFGGTIGNVLNGGETGWQVNETARRKGTRVGFAIYNPQWEGYLKYVDAGVAPHQKHPGNFVLAAWTRHMLRRKSK